MCKMPVRRRKCATNKNTKNLVCCSQSNTHTANCCRQAGSVKKSCHIGKSGFVTGSHGHYVRFAIGDWQLARYFYTPLIKYATYDVGYRSRVCEFCMFAPWKIRVVLSFRNASVFIIPHCIIIKSGFTVISGNPACTAIQQSTVVLYSYVKALPVAYR